MAAWAPLGAILFLLPLLASCGNPCRELSDTVCRCAPSRQEEQRCLRHIRSLSAQSPSQAGHQAPEQCQSLLETCTCSALANGNLAACGLTMVP